MKFEEFIENYNLKSKKRWTLSTKDKIPIDINHLLFGTTEPKIRGASYRDERCLNTYQTVSDIVDPSQYLTYFINAQNEDFLLIDIEPSAPTKLKNWMLNNIPFVYGELSQSGNGYHLVVPKPKSFDDFPTKTTKPSFKNKKKDFEILLNHYITFTKKEIPLPKNPKPIEHIDQMFRLIAKKQLDTVVSKPIDEIPEIPKLDTIVEYLNRCKIKTDINSDYFTKSDGTQDMSQYEFSVMSEYYYILNTKILKTTVFNKYTYSDEQKAYIIYIVTKNYLDYRKKHDTLRNNIPYLHNMAFSVIARHNNREKNKRKKG